MIDLHTCLIKVLVISSNIRARIAKLAPTRTAIVVPIIMNSKSLHRAYLNFFNIRHHQHVGT